MSSATREQFHKISSGARRFDTATLPISELVVRYRSLTARELSEHQSGNYDKLGNLRPGRMPELARRLFVLTIVDDDGNPILSMDDVAVLGGMDAADAEYLYDKIATHCGIKRADAETLRKNSSATDSAGTQ